MMVMGQRQLVSDIRRAGKPNVGHRYILPNWHDCVGMHCKALVVNVQQRVMTTLMRVVVK